MSHEVAKDTRAELLLAGLLSYGTWLASGVTALGLGMALVAGHPGQAGMGVVAAGAALFVSLPVLRVLLMFALFVRDRDYRLVAVTSVVLLTILAGVVLGLCTSNARLAAH